MDERTNMSHDADVPDGVTSTDFRRLTIEQMLNWLETHGEPIDPRPGVDTGSLRRRFPHVAEVQVTDVTVPGPHGRALPARAYIHPTTHTTGAGLVWAHGGAFFGGHLDMPEANWVALELAAEGVPVLSIDYSKCLGGVHYPAPSDDVLAAWSFALQNSETLLGVKPDRLVLGGASAGATLAASAVRRLSRDVHGNKPAGLVLVYPALHPDSENPDSPIEPDGNALGISTNYAGSHAALTNPDIFPGMGAGTGFPDTLIIACEFDGMRPSAERFEGVLLEAGVDVSYRLELGSDHGHINEPGHAGALRTIASMVTWITARAAAAPGIAGGQDSPTVMCE